MTQFIATAIQIAATLTSCALAFLMTRAVLAAMFRLLPAPRPPLRVITGGRARARVGTSLQNGVA